MTVVVNQYSMSISFYNKLEIIRVTFTYSADDKRIG